MSRMHVGDHAVVLGASMAGLFAARVLSEFYDRVTVVERDALTDGAEPRRGVPQSGQPHVLLARCSEIGEELFPGLRDELVADGGHRWDDGDLSRFNVCFGGHLVHRAGRIPRPEVIVNVFAGRPFIEGHVRRRVMALPNVEVLDGHDILGLVASGARVTGARVRRQGADAGTTLDADLVVDASGRGSRTPAFLAEMGFARPETDELTVRVAYASLPVRIPPGTVHEFLTSRLFEPGRPRGFMMCQCENDVWLVGAGSLGDVPIPSSFEEIIEFTKDIAPANLLDVLRAAEPLGPVSVHRYPCNRWRRYDRMPRFPEGLVIVGDAFCSFNPIYGQGMTVAAIESLILRDCLSAGSNGLARRYFRAAARKVRVAWQTAVGADLTLPEVAGRRPASVRLTNAYIDKVLAAAETDPHVAQEFLRVTGMVQPPSALLRPAFVMRVAKLNMRRPPTRRLDAVVAATASN